MSERSLSSDKIANRARNDAFLYGALQYGWANNMNELEIYEHMVHMLLGWKDEMYQKELDRRINSVEPLFPFQDLL